MIQSVSVTITGADTAYLGSRIRGRILAIKSDAALNAAYTVTISGETSGIPIITALAAVPEAAVTWWYPRAFPTNAAGTDATAVETAAMQDICVVNERIKVVTSVAASGTVTFTVYYDSDE